MMIQLGHGHMNSAILMHSAVFVCVQIMFHSRDASRQNSARLQPGRLALHIYVHETSRSLAVRSILSAASVETVISVRLCGARCLKCSVDVDNQPRIASIVPVREQSCASTVQASPAIRV
jgi:hypothetical protein